MKQLIYDLEVRRIGNFKWRSENPESTLAEASRLFSLYCRMSTFHDYDIRIAEYLVNGDTKVLRNIIEFRPAKLTN